MEHSRRTYWWNKLLEHVFGTYWWRGAQELLPIDREAGVNTDSCNLVKNETDIEDCECYKSLPLLGKERMSKLDSGVSGSISLILVEEICKEM